MRKIIYVCADFKAVRWSEDGHDEIAQNDASSFIGRMQYLGMLKKYMVDLPALLWGQPASCS